MADTAENIRLKAIYGSLGSRQKYLADAWMKAMGKEQDTQKSLNELRAKRVSDLSKNAAAYARARDAGTTSARVRAFVDLAKLRALAPIEFAKAATRPNVNLLDRVTQETNVVGAAEKGTHDKDVARRAWQVYLQYEHPEAGNVLGTYREMLRKYGDPAYLNVAGGEGTLRQTLTDIQDKAKTEQMNFEEFEGALEKTGPDSWAKFLRENPQYVGREGEDATFQAFLKTANIDAANLPGAGSAFISNLEEVARDPEKHPAMFADIDAAVEESNAEQKRYEDQLKDLSVLDVEDVPGESKDPTLREFLAGWVRRPEVKWWAEKNGFKLGTAEPVDPNSELGKEVAAGRYPDKVLVNGMLYTMSPDDIRAYRFADAQISNDPGNNVLRALGLARKTGPRTMVEVEEIVGEGQPPIVVKQGAYKDGFVALDDEGNFHWSTDDGKTWSDIEKTAGQNMMVEAEAAGEAEVVNAPLPGAVAKPKTRTRLLEYREPVYGRDYPNSVRGVDPETGEEVYLPPEKVAKTFFPAGEPSKGPSLAERLNKASAKATMKKEGHDLSDEAQNQDVPGPKPTAAQKKERSETTAAMREVVKPVTSYTKVEAPPAPAPEKAPERRTYEQAVRERAKAVLPGTPMPDVVGGGTGPQVKEAPKARVQAGEVSTEAGTTTPSTTTPTASTATDAQKKALLESRKRRKQEEVDAQAAGAQAGAGAAP